MKRLLLVLIVIPFLCHAQQVRHTAFLDAPSFSIFRSLGSESTSGSFLGSFGVGAGYGMEHHFPKRISLGISMAYSLSRGNFYTPCHCFRPQDIKVSIRNTISAHTIDIPVYINVRTNGNENENQFLYLKSGFGSSIMLSTHRVVEKEVDFLDGSSLKTEEIGRGGFQLKNGNNNIFGWFFSVAVGHSFRITNLDLYSELAFKQDINPWNYPMLENSDGLAQVKFRRQSFVLRTGILF